MKRKEEKKKNINKFWDHIEFFLKKFVLNKKIFLTLLAVIIIVLTVTIVVVYSRDKRNKEIKNLYIQAFYEFNKLNKDIEKLTLKKAEKAIFALEDVIRTDYHFPEYYLAYYNLGCIYLALKELNSAKKYFSKLKEADQDLFVRGKALINLAKILQNQIKYEQAISVYNNIISEYDNFYKDFALYLRGLCYERRSAIKDLSKKGDIDMAISSYKMVRKDSIYKKDADKNIEVIEKLKRLNQ